MRVIGFNFTKINATRAETQINNLKINYNLDIVNITKEKIELFKEEEVLNFSFKYIITYEKDFASITFEGNILAVLDSKQLKEILKEWKDKKVSEDVRMGLFNLIMARCNIKALQLSEDLALPPHIPLPKIGSPQESKK